jgi:hypothetical protein
VFVKKIADKDASAEQSDSIPPIIAALNATPQCEPLSTVETPALMPEKQDRDPNRNFRKRKSHPRRHQLHLWINEREYTLLKSLAELQEEPMSRVVRRLISHWRHLVERKAI